MQAQCPECSTRFQLDDSKVPDHAFKVRCPRCQHVVVLPGSAKDEAAAPAESPSAPAPPEPAPARPPRPVKREHTGPDGAEDALVAVPDAELARTFTEALARLEYNVDVAEDAEEGARLLEQGAYAVAITSKAGAEPGHETLAQRVLRLPPDMRRRVFVVLAGDEFRTADGTQAWGAMVDLVVHPRDAETCECPLRLNISYPVKD